jgi:hypothetical protein
MPPTYIELDAFSLTPSEAEAVLRELLASYGQDVTPEFRSGARSLTVTQRDGEKTQVTFAGLITEIHLFGASKLHQIRWRDTDPYGTVAFAVPPGLPEFVIGTGPRTSPPLAGPGYATNDVVSELLEDVLVRRKETATLSHQDDMFRAAFRAYRSYLSACVSSVDAYLNSLSWFTRKQPTTALSFADMKLLTHKTLPLNEKLRRWLPIITGGANLSESGNEYGALQAIKEARNAVIHVNEPDFLFSLPDAALILNLCRDGVGGVLRDISRLLGRYPSEWVIRVAFAPRARYSPIR